LIGGINKDFAGAPLTSTMDIGLYKYSATPNVILVSSTNTTCKTRNDGTITLNGSGGSAPYTYKVGTSAFTTTTSYTGLKAGTYVCTIKDSKGLISSINVTIKGSSVVVCP
jgi:hypothetical protein